MSFTAESPPRIDPQIMVPEEIKEPLSEKLVEPPGIQEPIVDPMPVEPPKIPEPIVDPMPIEPPKIPEPIVDPMPVEPPKIPEPIVDPMPVEPPKIPEPIVDPMPVEPPKIPEPIVDPMPVEPPKIPKPKLPPVANKKAKKKKKKKKKRKNRRQGKTIRKGKAPKPPVVDPVPSHLNIKASKPEPKANLDPIKFPVEPAVVDPMPVKPLLKQKIGGKILPHPALVKKENKKSRSGRLGKKSRRPKGKGPGKSKTKLPKPAKPAKHDRPKKRPTPEEPEVAQGEYSTAVS